MLVCRSPSRRLHHEQRRERRWQGPGSRPCDRQIGKFTRPKPTLDEMNESSFGYQPGATCETSEFQAFRILEAAAEQTDVEDEVAFMIFDGVAWCCLAKPAAELDFTEDEIDVLHPH